MRPTGEFCAVSGRRPHHQCRSRPQGRHLGAGLPAPVRALEDAGIIKGFTALLNDKALGFEVTAFAMIRLHSQAEADLVAFEERARSSPIVRDCYMLSRRG